MNVTYNSKVKWLADANRVIPAEDIEYIGRVGIAKTNSEDYQYWDVEFQVMEQDHNGFGEYSIGECVVRNIPVTELELVYFGNSPNGIYKEIKDGDFRGDKFYTAYNPKHYHSIGKGGAEYIVEEVENGSYWSRLTQGKKFKIWAIYITPEIVPDIDYTYSWRLVYPWSWGKPSSDKYIYENELTDIEPRRAYEVIL